MKSHILLTIVLCGTLVMARGQRLVGRIPCPLSIHSFQAQRVGDSIYFSYYAGVDPERPYANWILPDGTIKEIKLKLLGARQVCGITVSRNGDKLFYFLGKENEMTLNVLRVEPITNKQSVLPGHLVILGRLIDVTPIGEKLVVYSFEKKKLQLRVTELIGISVVNEKVYDLSFDPGRLKERDIALIPDNRMPAPVEAVAKFKIFPRTDAIYVVLDDTQAWEVDVPRTHGTTLIRLDKTTGVRTIRYFEEPGTDPFSSYLCGDYLFRNHGLYVSVFSLIDGKNLPAIQPPFEKHMRDRSVYLKKGNNNRIWCRGTNMYTKDVGTKYVIGYLDSVGNYVLMIGSTEHSPPGGFVPMVSGLGLLFQVFTATSAMMERASSDITETSTYFYLTGKPDKGFDFSLNPTGIIHQEVDAYEVGQTVEKVDFQFKSYLQSINRVTAFYVVSGDKAISIFEF